MDILAIKNLYDKTNALKELYAAKNERRKFSNAVCLMLSNELPYFQLHVKLWNDAASAAPYPFWEIEQLDTVEEMYYTLKSIFVDAVYYDTPVRYYAMRHALQELFTPINKYWLQRSNGGWQPLPVK